MPVMLHSEIFLKDYGHKQRGKEGSNDPLTFLQRLLRKSILSTCADSSYAVQSRRYMELDTS